MMEIDRADGRTPNQLRPLACSRNILHRAHGSASWSQGNSLSFFWFWSHGSAGDTKVLAAVYGPKAGTKKNENPEKACIEVIWKPKTGQIGKLEKEYEMILKRTLQSICILTINPNTTTSVIVQVVHDDGALLTCAINAACAALVDAGIPIKHLAVAICCCLAEDGYVILDPTKLEEQLRFGKVNKDLCNTNVFEHSGKFYSIAENQIAQEIDIISRETLGNWDVNGAWKRPFSSHPKVLDLQT
ncbi:hypothetical protein GH714_030833 [Hevea brasiliensis]|uniref:Exoribonuclease phosphorolytic domain-containing protein n=1 Tax=Hevea brasiliensis TaxID=3981 RepID=A0A6A6LTR9_HEVBR|nr:hypothetical protein GH714_030833 [Hevea brasiliensis]